MTDEIKRMLFFARKTLRDYSHHKGSLRMIGYSKYDHTLRVMSWLKRLYEHCDFKERVRYEDVLIAAALHDVGYAAAEDAREHAVSGAGICREQLERAGFPEERVRYITFLVRHHSEKGRMADPEIDPGLLLLMEADLLDDTGALSVVIDCRAEQAKAPENGFEACLEHIRAHTLRHQEGKNPMVTPWGRQVWNEKCEIARRFAASLEQDLPDVEFRL